MRRALIRLKHAFFQVYWVAALVAGVGLCWAFWTGDLPLDQLLAGLGLLLPLVYFVQKQKLEELMLFRELFAGFNERYDGLNEDLNRILAGSAPLTPEDEERLDDYFNLCGEEYLYYRRGYIFSEVWEAWLNGMMQFYEDERIGAYWESELSTGSYYGLENELRRRAGRRKPRPIGSPGWSRPSTEST